MFDTVVTYYELRFENKGYETMVAQQKERTQDTFPIKAAVLFEMFPFSILYNVSEL